MHFCVLSSVLNSNSHNRLTFKKEFKLPCLNVHVHSVSKENSYCHWGWEEREAAAVEGF